MASGWEVTCPYHETTERVASIPHLLECGCKCMKSFERKADADSCADEEGGQVVEYSRGESTHYAVVIYVPTAVTTPK